MNKVLTNSVCALGIEGRRAAVRDPRPLHDRRGSLLYARSRLPVAWDSCRFCSPRGCPAKAHPSSPSSRNTYDGEGRGGRVAVVTGLRADLTRLCSAGDGGVYCV